MGTFETTIEREISLSPLEQLAQAKAPAGDLGPEDGDVIEIEVTVEYDEGFYTPAKINGRPEDCYPADGADPEITSVVTLDGAEIVETLSGSELTCLILEATDDQQHSNDADEAAAEDAYHDRLDDLRYEDELSY